MRFHEKIDSLLERPVRNCLKCSHCKVFKDPQLEDTKVRCDAGFWQKATSTVELTFFYSHIFKLEHMKTFALGCPEYDGDEA